MILNLCSLNLHDEIFVKIRKLDSLEFPLPWTLNAWKDLLKSPQKYKLYIYLNDEELIGYSLFLLSPAEKLAHLLKIIISSKYRNAGFAHSLMTHSVLLFELDDIVKFFLEVEVDNTRALSLYEGFGFIKVCVVKKFYSNNKDAYRMIYENLVKS